MELQIVATYFFADEVLKANHFHDDPQAHMSTAEIMTVAISAARFFYGIRAHVIATTNQEPIEIVFASGCENDGKVFKQFDLDLSPESTIYADKAYNSYFDEDFLKENKINFVAARKENAKRQLSGCLHYLQNYWRKRIETTFSRITAFFPKKIHAVTSRGFELKAFLFILAYSLSLIIH